MKAKQLVLRWSWITAGLIASFWTFWYLITSEVPVITSVKMTQNWTYALPFSISRWWDILIGPIWSTAFIITFLLSNKLYDENMPIVSDGTNDDVNFVNSVVFGRYFGLGLGLLGGLISGLVFVLTPCLLGNLVLGLGFSLLISSLAGFALGLYFTFDFNLGFSLAFSLSFSLIFGLFGGLVFGLSSGLIVSLFFGLFLGPYLFIKWIVNTI